MPLGFLGVKAVRLVSSTQAAIFLDRTFDRDHVAKGGRERRSSPEDYCPLTDHHWVQLKESLLANQGP